jgi:hypothetical protein
MTYLYIVDHYVPSSEYGGVWNVIAKDDNECFDLIVSEDNEDEWNDYSNYFNKLRENVIKAQRFALANDQTSRVVESFIT